MHNLPYNLSLFFLFANDPRYHPVIQNSDKMEGDLKNTDQ